MLLHGKVVFEETFVSPIEKNTKSEALIVLDEIRKAHPIQYGWKEISGYAEQLNNGKWRAVRHHVKHELVLS
ncbi:MAG: hypothetical protein E7311_00180 [Clostridiales bacterium]|nr:hypothetical protein [Clostridiales bacterium]